MPICVFTDLIVKGKNARLINTKWVGTNFKQLFDSMSDYYSKKLDKTNLLIGLTGFALIGFVAY